MVDLTQALLEIAQRNLINGADEAAAESLRRAHQLAPLDFRPLLLLAGIGVVAHNERQRALAQTILLSPDLADVWDLAHQLGLNGMAAGRRAALIEPLNAARAMRQGVQALATGQPTTAIDWFAQALIIDPGPTDSYYNLGCALMAAQAFGSARAPFRHARLLRPDHGDAWLNEGTVLQILARHKEALACYRQAEAVQPDSPPVISNIGFALRELGQFDSAITYLTATLARQPLIGDAHVQLALGLKARGRMVDALTAIRHARAIAPHMPEAYSNEAQVLVALSRMETIGKTARRAFDLAPTSPTMGKTLLFLMNYDAGLTPAKITAATDLVINRLRPGFGPKLPKLRGQDLDPERRLRIGYITSDLRNHPVMRVLSSIMGPRGERDHHVTLFNLGTTRDFVTDQIEAQADQVISVAGLLDKEIAAVIRQSQIDILTILAGRFDDNRLWLGVFRPAPIIVSQYDLGSSGIEETDYVLADPIVVPLNAPEGVREDFNERLVRVPHLYSHDPIASAPPLSAPPCMENGVITFGSFNNPAKLNSEVLALWGKVVRAVPGARLMLHFRDAFAELDLQRRIVDGVALDADRVIFSTARRAALNDHLALYHQVDIALDPFPFNGSTTSFEALWMGVPVLGPIGTMMLSRWTASLMIAAGLKDWVARDQAQVIDFASKLNADRGLLAKIRATTRQKLAASYVCDGKRRRRDLDRIYRAMWRHHCRAFSSN
jgi:predicted O-linked N-acetylglucosamine transferase (SPINDLY family)